MTDDAGADDQVRVLLDAPLHVHYGFLDLLPFAAEPTPDGLAYAGQPSGIVGARRAGALSMRTGTHTGSVPVRVEAHPRRPEVPDGWEDVVEVPFVPAGARYRLQAFDSGEDLTLPLDVGRARWCADRLDDAHQAPADEPDRYLLQLWPAPTAPLEVVRAGSRQAASWAGVASDAYPVDLPPAREWAEPTRQDSIRALREAQRRRLREQRPMSPRPFPQGSATTATRSGGPGRPAAGRPAPGRTEPGRSEPGRSEPGPSPVALMHARLSWLADTHPALAARVAAAPAAEQRAVTAWAARRLVVAAGVLGDDDVVGVLDGRPAPQVDREELTWRLTGDLPASRIGSGDPVPAPDARSHPRAAALLATLATVGQDPTRAAVDAVTLLVRQAADRDQAVADVADRLDRAARHEVPDEERVAPTDDDRVRLRQAELQRDEDDAARRRAARDRHVWGPVRPSPRLRALPGNASWLHQHHHDLAERLAHAPADAQRTVALWGARRAVQQAGLSSDPELAALLDAVASGGPVPPVDRNALFDRFFPGPGRLVVTTGTPAGPPPRLHPTAVALDAVLAALHDDPAAAAVATAAVVLHDAVDAGPVVAEVTALLDGPPPRH